MIYLDNSATTLQKPPAVLDAVFAALSSLGNAGRACYTPSLEATRMIYTTREKIAQLVSLENPLQVAFTSGATESLNLLIGSLVKSADHVITSVLEHNSVLRPLYRTNCQLSFLPCNESGELELGNIKDFLQENTKYVFCTHGSNVTGAITDTAFLRNFCKQNGLFLILDISQTLGEIPVHSDMADIFCFTGHKALFGPQGTGGIIVRNMVDFSLTKTGGSGYDSFSKHQPLVMPDIFEAGTQNVPGIAGLEAGVEFVLETGIETIRSHADNLRTLCLEHLKKIPEFCLYGPYEKTLPIISFNVGNIPSEELAGSLWERYQIATRAGFHCAPLVHEAFQTKEQGMLRLSFSYFTTQEEVIETVAAIGEIVEERM